MTTIEERYGELWTKCETKIGTVSIKETPILAYCVTEDDCYQAFIYICQVEKNGNLVQGYTMTPGFPSVIANQLTEIDNVLISKKIKLYAVKGGFRLN